MIGNDDGFRLTLEDTNIDFVSSSQFIVFFNRVNQTGPRDWFPCVFSCPPKLTVTFAKTLFLPFVEKIVGTLYKRKVQYGRVCAYE